MNTQQHTHSLNFPSFKNLESFPTKDAHPLRTITIHNRPIQIIATPDHHPMMQKAYRLWYDVYIEELKYPLSEGVNHNDKTLSLPPNGSIVFMAMDGEDCVASLRATYEQFSHLEFNYKKLIPNKRIGELSKLIALKHFRKTNISAHILIACYDYNIANGNNKLYDVIVINTTPKMLFYYRMFGFKKASDELFTHPDLKNKGFLLRCSIKDNKKVVSELKKLVADDLLVKLKWTIKYWWYKNIAGR